MDTRDDLPYEDRIFQHICTAIDAALRRVDIRHGRINVSAATEGELRLWESEQMGGFRRFERNRAEWTNSDRRKFGLLIRAPATFYVRMHPDNAQIFPSRSALC